MGGGISSAVARALGAGRRDDADAIVLHALVIGAIFAVFFCVAVIAGGPWLYARARRQRRGARRRADLLEHRVRRRDPDLDVQRAREHPARHRQHGVPAVVTIGGAALLVPLSPCLIFGFGPFPPLGVAGGAIALLIYYGLGTAIYAFYLWSGRSVVRPNLLGTRLRWPLFYDIFRVGAVASVISLMTNATIALTTGAGRGVRRGRDRRLRRRHAAGIHAGAAVVRVRRRTGRAGRHQHRRRPARQRAARRLDRRLGFVRAHRSDRRLGRAVSGGVAVAVRAAIPR